MEEKKRFRQSELVLEVSMAYDGTRLDYEAWRPFVDRLCGTRDYQKEAIRRAVVFLASGRYGNLEELAKENYEKSGKLKEKYPSLEEFLEELQMREKLYADIDLATGTGKSYVIYGIAQIALGLGLVKRVLVLTPSLTIEAGLTEKFQQLSADPGLKASIPEEAVLRNPSIVTANETVKTGDLCVENIHAVYQNTGSSIEDSFAGSGADTLVLNDEAHHIFNRPAGNRREDGDIKKWKEFLLDSKYDFRYMLGFTGTAYLENEYFPDVIFRYSLRQAIEDRVVKTVDYVREDDSGDDWERFQKIYQNHQRNARDYSKVKPLTILVTRDIRSAKELSGELVQFLMTWEEKSREEVDAKVLLVTSAREHRANVEKLRYVDDREEPTEWIVSVSMLTEGWDVKNVFQIVPWKERAFNSHLLIAQVLGRGLRVPEAYLSPQPKVTVFNHSAWSGKIKNLVEEVLEIEARIYSQPLLEGARSQYHFSLRNIDYTTIQKEEEKKIQKESVDFSRLMEEGIALESQSLEEEQETVYESALGQERIQRDYEIRSVTYSVAEVVDMIYDQFEEREWEGRTLRLGEQEYTKNQLPPRESIENMIRVSMEKRGNQGEEIVEKNVHKILTAFAPLLRKKSKSVVTVEKSGAVYEVSTRNLARQSVSISLLRQDHTVFFTNNWEEEIKDPEQKRVVEEFFEDETFPISARRRDLNYGWFKTPVTTVITASRPERKFVDQLCKKENAQVLDAWIKSGDRGFYEISYSCRYGGGRSKTRKYFHSFFNPDFFLKITKGAYRYYLVVEIKEDKDDSEENKAKNRYARQHFEELNHRLEAAGEKERYLFHFLSPNGYTAFFDQLRSGTILEGPDTFKCELELLLEEAGEQEF